MVSEKQTNWYNCARCDAGYDDQRCTCAGEVTMGISATSEQERAKFTEFCTKRTLDNFNYVVQVTHQDGSVFILHNSSLWVSEVLSTEGLPRFIGVATEHTGNYFFFVDDLHSWSKMRQI